MMKYLFLVFILLFPLTATSKSNTTLSSVGELVWKNRVILIFSEESEKYQPQLENYLAGINDRDVVWFIIDGSKVTTNYPGKLSDEFAADAAAKYSDPSNKVILVGKDGGIKNKTSELNLDKLFQQIDSMPMRIIEMKEQ